MAGKGSLQRFRWEGCSGRLRCREGEGAAGAGEARVGKRSSVGEVRGMVQMAEGGGGGQAEAAEFSGEWRGGHADD